MNIKLIEKEITYTGAELAPHWIYKNFHLLGDSAAAFIGKCDVHLTEMVDLEDVINEEPIFSSKMLNIIIEHFNICLTEGVCRQRLLIAVIKEALEALIPGIIIVRNGDDLFYENKKLTVSIATKSPTSVLIHTGINIDPAGAPVDAAGLLTHIGVNDIRGFALTVLEKYKNEMETIVNASCKVRGVM